VRVAGPDSADSAPSPRLATNCFASASSLAFPQPWLNRPTSFQLAPAVTYQKTIWAIVCGALASARRLSASWVRRSSVNWSIPLIWRDSPAAGAVGRMSWAGAFMLTTGVGKSRC